MEGFWDWGIGLIFLWIVRCRTGDIQFMGLGCHMSVILVLLIVFLEAEVW